MDIQPMGQDAYDALMAAPKEPAVGAMRCCGFTVSELKSTVPIAMLTRCPHCGQVWEVLSS